MSGSSLDGLDIAYCTITAEDDHYSYVLQHCTHYAYGEKELRMLSDHDAQHDHSVQSIAFGNYCAEKIKHFVEQYSIKNIDLISSHGHTLYHYPERGITLQIGDGKTIAEQTGITVINNFRQKDIDAGGQGAPLVPICDAYLFSNYTACLNLGGIANISFTENKQRIGFDICAANQLLNHVAKSIGLDYDDKGALAAKGKIYAEFLSQLNAPDYFSKPYPKSMDNGEIRKTFLPLLDKAALSAEDKLATITEHIALQISSVMNKHMEQDAISADQFNLLVTGGGAYNDFLIERIEKLCGLHITLPDDTVIEYKEALAMCLMGVLYMESKPNFLPSVTGAGYAVCGGEIYKPTRK